MIKLFRNIDNGDCASFFHNSKDLCPQEVECGNIKNNIDKINFRKLKEGERLCVGDMVCVIFMRDYNDIESIIKEFTTIGRITLLPEDSEEPYIEIDNIGVDLATEFYTSTILKITE